MKTGQAAIAAAVLASVTAAASAGMPYPHAGTPQPQDAGALSLARGNGTMTVTVALKLRQDDELERLVRDLHTPGHASFHRFLSPAQFQQRFAPSRDTVDQAIAHFRQAGLSATLEAGSLLRVTGSTAAME